MEALKNSLSKFKLRKTTSKAEFDYQALAEEMSEYFKVKYGKVIWMFYRYELRMIREAFYYAQKEGKDLDFIIKRVAFMTREGKI